MTIVIPAEVITAAKTAATATGIPASVTLAQWALESGWGAHMPPGSNNPFGIKARLGAEGVNVPTKEFIKGKWVTINASFAKYPNLSQAFVAHADLLAEGGAYAQARMFENDPEHFAMLLTGYYATDPSYGKLLVSIMKSHDFEQYDKTA